MAESFALLMAIRLWLKTRIDAAIKFASLVLMLRRRDEEGALVNHTLNALASTSRSLSKMDLCA